MQTTTHESITKYIDTAIDRVEKTHKKALKEYHQESMRHMTALKQGFQDDVKKAGEMVSALVTVSRAREIVHEETKSLVTRVDLIQKEVGIINKKLA